MGREDGATHGIAKLPAHGGHFEAHPTTPAEAGVQLRNNRGNSPASPNWTPAFAGVVWSFGQDVEFRNDGPSSKERSGQRDTGTTLSARIACIIRLFHLPTVTGR